MAIESVDIKVGDRDLTVDVSTMDGIAIIWEHKGNETLCVGGFRLKGDPNLGWDQLIRALIPATEEPFVPSVTRIWSVQDLSTDKLVANIKEAVESLWGIDWPHAQNVWNVDLIFTASLVKRE